MSEILDGKSVAAAIRAEVAEEVARLTAAGHRRPGLAAILVGDDPASKAYVGSKTRACEETGMKGEAHLLPASTSETELLAKIDQLNGDDEIDGVLVQLPLPEALKARERVILDQVLPQKDVDGFHPMNVGRLWLGGDTLVPATPLGVLELLRRRQIPLSGKHAVIVGRSNIVGKPMAALLLQENCTVTVCHSRTRDLPAVCREADLLVAAIGRAAFIGPEHVKPGAVVIDVGINRVSDKAEVEKLFPEGSERRATFAERGSILVGDVDFTRVEPLASAITPVPGGVGLLTVALLMVNTVTACHRRQGLG